MKAYGVRPQAMEGMTGMDLLRTLKVDMRHKLRPKIIWVDWSPPPSGCLKLNVDGVSKAGFSAAVQLVLMSLLCLLLLSMKVSVAAVGFGLLGTVYVLCLVAAADGASTLVWVMLWVFSAEFFSSLPYLTLLPFIDQGWTVFAPSHGPLSAHQFCAAGFSSG
ncbi:unnamed protein product [Ilex paraguariensis]|uniref:Uncharacterized protein n=1 Tax=Ilex paraguariensis TaxID=185542 RepID=A0ABC8TCU7_9AQUA